MRQVLFVATTVLLTGALAGEVGKAAQAQEQAAPAIEEVVVTAQRRAERLQDVPIAISAFDESAIREAGIESIDDVGPRTPGFTFTQFNLVQPQLYIRGIGSTDDSAAGDNSVVVFVDDVYVGRAAAFDVDLFDLERIEVLRGPQGTLYGKNAVGGAINIISRKPDEDPRARLEATGGNFETLRARGMLSGPLVAGSLYGKVAFSTRDRDGFTKHAITGSRLRDEDGQSVRAQARWLPLPDLEVLLSADASFDRQAGNAREPSGEPFVFFPWFAPGSPFAPVPSSPDPFVAEQNIDGFQDRDVWGASARIDWTAAMGTFTSITAYRTSDFQLSEDFDGTTAGLIINNIDEEAEQFSQELRLTSPGGGRFDWVLGLYYLWEQTDRLDNNDFSGNDDGLADFFGIPRGVLPTFQIFYDQDNTTNSYAVFGQGTYGFTDRINLTLGLRYTYEKKHSIIDASGFDPTASFLVAPYSADARESWGAFTPKATLDFAVTDGVMAYASISRGFKSGGFNGSAASLDAAETPFDPEYALNYELGVKSDWFDRRLLFNVTGFYTDYSDLQVFQLVDGAKLVVDNAADATSKGVELELVALPVTGLDISGSYAHLDAEYDEFINEDGEDFSGNRLTRAPKHSLNLAMQYRFPLGAAGMLALRGEYTYQSRLFFDPDNFALVGDDGHDLFNLRLAYETSDRQWEVALWAKNVFDEEYVIHAIDGRGPFNLSQNASTVLGAPRTYGITVTWRYGK